MASYNTLKDAIQDVIKTNGNKEITGQVLQDSLIAMINSLGAGYQFMGVATPLTNPGTPDQNVFYIGGAGTYSNFGTAIQIPQGSLCVFAYNGEWVKNTILLVNVVNDLITGGANNALSAEQGKNLYLLVNGPANWTMGYYLSKVTGLPVTNVGWSISNVFQILDNITIKLNGTVTGSSVAAVVFLDENKTPMASTTGGIIENGTFDNATIAIPANAKYVQFCKKNDDVILFDFQKSAYQEIFNDKVLDQIGLLNNLRNAEIPVKWIYDEYINKDSGNFVSQTGFARTGLIDIHGLSPLYLNGTVDGGVVAGVAMFDSNCNYIGAAKTAGTYTNEPISLSDNVYYIALSTRTSYSDGLKLSVNTAPQALMNGIVQDRLVEVKYQWYTHNYVRKGTGVINMYGSVNFQISQNIKVNYRHNYYVTTNGIGNAQTASMIAFYAADGSFLGELNGPASAATADQYDMLKLAIPANTAYMIVTRTSNNYTSQWIRILTDDSMVNVNSYSDEADSLDIQTKITAGGTVKLANRNYTVTAPIEVPSNCKIIGQGNTTMYLDTATSPTCIFHLDNKENVHISGIKFDGQATINPGSPSSSTNPSVMTVSELRSRSMEGTKTAILIENGDRYNLIENCDFTGFNKAGVVFYRSHDTHWKHCKISNCQFYNNWYGLLLDVRAEFTNISNCSFNLNKVGVYVAGGNNVFSNNHYDGNEVGFCVCSTLGENADHGSSTGSTYNHNTVYGIACIDASSGFLFTAASCYEGTMLFDNCNAIQVVNSVITVNVINQYTNDPSVVPTRSGISMLTNNLFKATYMQDPNNPIPNKQKLVLKNNYWYTGADSTDLNN